MSNKVKVIPKEELFNLHTGTLMSRRKNLLQCDESFQLSDRFDLEAEPDPKETGLIEYKNSKEWQKAYAELKEVLSTREHFKK